METSIDSSSLSMFFPQISGVCEDLDSTLNLDLAIFENEAVAWSNFLLASCFMMVFLFGGLVQYLSLLDDLDVHGWFVIKHGWKILYEWRF